MIDAEQYQAKLWDLSFAASPPDGFDLWVSPDIDVGVLGELPALTWNLVGDGQAADGPAADGFILNVTIFGEGMDQAKDAAIYVDDIALAWFDDPWPTAIEVDGLRIVLSDGERIDTPTRTGQADIAGRNVVQYSGSYRILLRN